MFWTVVVVQLVLWLLPMGIGSLVLYPFSVLATWAHELGHALAALLVGGRPRSIELFFTLSGLTQSGGYEGAGAQAVVSAGGLLGAPVAGFFMLLASATPRGAVLALGALTASLALALVLLMTNVQGWILGSAVVLLLGLGTWRLDLEKRFIFAQLIALQLLLSVWSNWRYLFAQTAYVSGQQLGSDVEQIAQALGGSYWIWGVLIGALDLGLIYGAYRFVRWRLRRDAGAADPATRSVA